MAANETGTLAKLLRDNEATILPEWLELQKEGGALQSRRIVESELATQCTAFLPLLRDALARGGTQVADAAYEPAREFLGEVSRSRAMQGFSPTETATFIFSLKLPLFNAANRDKSIAPAALARLTCAVTQVLDELCLYSFEIFQKSREEVIQRQQREITELSTPVVKLWQGILALPIIGTLDSERTQVVMENLLQSIVDSGAEIAVIDITGVPTVDTLTAQHLLKTVAAARLMGADCIISGIRPQIAQTMVHLGVELNVVTKATLADAFAVALRRTGRAVTRVKPAAGEKNAQAAQGE
jgi:rsbT co-antagonist protein RsbR